MTSRLIAVLAGLVAMMASAPAAVAAQQDGPVAGDADPMETGVPADSDRTPVQSISALTLHEVRIANGERVRVRGTVLDERPGEYIIVRDDTGTVFAETRLAVMPRIKQEVDLWGTLAWDGARGYLENATFRAVGDHAPAALEPIVPATRPAELPLLTNAWEVRDLSPDRAAWQYPVRLRAVVTVNTRLDSSFFCQDESSGIYIRMKTDRADVKPGDVVAIEGVSDPGGFAPIVVASNVTIVGKAVLPAPRPVTLFQLATGQEGSQWIEVRGVVHSLAYRGGVARIKLSDPSGTLSVNFPAASEPTNLLDAIVRIQGACGSEANSKRQLTALQMWASSLDCVQIEEPGVADPLSQPAKPIVSLSQFRPRQTLQRRVAVSGVVTFCQSGQSFILQDESDGVQVLSSRRDDLKPGDRVLVSGYPGLGEYGSVLRDAVFRVTGAGSVPRPELIAAGNALDPRLHNRWVQIKARFLSSHRIGSREAMTLQFADRVFEAQCLAPTASLKIPADSLLNLSGVYRVLADEARVPSSFQILVPSADDIQMLEKPAWWTFSHTMTAIGVLGILAAASILWVLVLRRKINEQTASLQQSEQKFRSLVEQSLVGVYIIQDGRFAYVNPRLGAIFGYAPDEMRTLTVKEVVFEEDLPLVENHIRRRVAGETDTVHYSFRVRRKDGSIVSVEALGTRTDYNGGPAVVGTLLDVTERKRAEAALAEASSLLETMLENCPDRIYFKDRESRFVRYSGSFAKLLNLPDVNFLRGKSDFDIFTEEHARPAFEDEQQIIRTGEPVIGKLEKETPKGGATTWALSTKVPWRDKDGKIIGTFGISKDMTAIKEAEEKLAHERELFRVLVDHLPDNIYFKDRDCRFVRISKSKAKTTLAHARNLYLSKCAPANPAELPPHLATVDAFADYLIGKTDFDTYDESFARMTFEEEQTIITTGNPLLGKLDQVRNPDGSLRWVLTTKMPWRDSAGNIVGTFGVSKDVTAIKEAEEKLAYERELFHALVDNLPDAIYFKDRQSRFVRLSRSKVERSRQVLLKRYRAEHPAEDTDHLPPYLTDTEKCGEYLAGKTDFDVYSEERAHSAYNEEQQIILTGQPLIGKLEQTTLADGTPAWYLTTKMPWRNRDGHIIGTFGVSRDISSLKDAEAQLELAHKRLIESSRLAGMAEVATDVLHNVGNVLNSVNVSCSLTIDRIKSSKISSLARVAALLQENREGLGEFLTNNPRGQQLPGYLAALAEHLAGEQNGLLKELEHLLKHIDHIKQIVAMQQSYAKVAGVTEPVSPSQLVEDALNINAAALMRHDVRVRREFGEAPVLQTEKHKVLQILVNLIRNAKYALDEANRPDKLMTIRVGSGAEGRVQIQVIDNGVGIPKENLTRIFAHGFTTRSDGHGFGLHSSALAVRELGGSLHAHSDGPGTGATFTLLLPRQLATEPQKAA